MGVIIGRNLKHKGSHDVDIMQRANGNYCVLELNLCFIGRCLFSYEGGVNMPLAIIQRLKEEEVILKILQPESDKMFAGNDYLMEIK